MNKKTKEKKQIKNIIFDFDGVIIDTSDLCYGSTKLTSNMNLTKKQWIEKYFCGNVLEKTINSFSKKEIADFKSHSKEEFKKLRIDENIKKEIGCLSKKYNLFIVTSNLKQNLLTCFKNSKMKNYFKEILCADFHSCKEQKIRYLSQKYDFKISEAVFITDTLGDLKEANKTSIKSVAVTFGFHNKKLLKIGCPFKFVNKFEEIRKIIEEFNKNFKENQKDFIRDLNLFLSQNKDSNEEEKIQAVFKLMTIGDDKSLKGIVGVLKNDSCPIVRHEAAFALGETSNSKIALNALKWSCNNDKEYIVIHECLLAIGTIAKKSEEKFIQKFTKHKNIIVKKTAKVALQRLNLDFEPYNGIKEFK